MAVLDSQSSSSRYAVYDHTYTFAVHKVLLLSLVTVDIFRQVLFQLAGVWQRSFDCDKYTVTVDALLCVFSSHYFFMLRARLK
jgi:hypothetical protein